MASRWRYLSVAKNVTADRIYPLPERDSLPEDRPTGHHRVRVSSSHRSKLREPIEVQIIPTPCGVNNVQAKPFTKRDRRSFPIVAAARSISSATTTFTGGVSAFFFWNSVTEGLEVRRERSSTPRVRRSLAPARYYPESWWNMCISSLRASEKPAAKWKPACSNCPRVGWRQRNGDDGSERNRVRLCAFNPLFVTTPCSSRPPPSSAFRNPFPDFWNGVQKRDAV